MEADARKVLETPSPESVSELRRARIDKTGWMISYLKDKLATLASNVSEIIDSVSELYLKATA